MKLSPVNRNANVGIQEGKWVKMESRIHKLLWLHFDFLDICEDVGELCCRRCLQAPFWQPHWFTSDFNVLYFAGIIFIYLRVARDQPHHIFAASRSSAGSTPRWKVSHFHSPIFLNVMQIWITASLWMFSVSYGEGFWLHPNHFWSPLSTSPAWFHPTPRLASCFIPAPISQFAAFSISKWFVLCCVIYNM